MVEIRHDIAIFRCSNMAEHDTTISFWHVRCLGDAIFKKKSDAHFWDLSDFFEYSSPISNFSQSKPISEVFQCAHIAKMDRKIASKPFRDVRRLSVAPTIDFNPMKLLIGLECVSNRRTMWQVSVESVLPKYEFQNSLTPVTLLILVVQYYHT